MLANRALLHRFIESASARQPVILMGNSMGGMISLMEASASPETGNSVRMSIAIFSYLDKFSFGLTADYDAAPDLNVLLEGIGRGLAELGQDAIAI